jgi:adenylate cyclase
MMSKKLVRGLVVGLAAFAVAWLASQTPLFRPLEWKSWDARLSLLSNPARAGRDIVIFYVDQYSLDVFAKQGVSWPWPRQMYSAVVKYLTAGRAKAVFFDMIFSEASVYGEADDADLSRTLTDSGRVFLPVFLSAAKEEGPGAADRLKRLDLAGRTPPRGPVASLNSVSLPLDAFLNACRGAGNVQFSPDGDSIYRRIPLVFSYRSLILPALPLALSEFAGGKLELDKIPLDPTGQLVIRYHGPLGTYKSYNIAAIINSWAQIEEGRAPQVQPAEFSGKVVLIGGSAPGLLDLRPSPLNPKSPGTEIQAAALDNLLRHDFVRFPAPAASFALLLVFCLLTGVGATHLRRVVHIVLFLVVCLALPAAAALLAMASGYWQRFVAPEFGVLASFIGAAIVNYNTEGKQRRFIKNAFRYYLSPAVIEQVLNDPSRLRLGGEKRDISSFFSDVAGFTSISESLKPEELVNLLNAFLSEMTGIILDTGGTLDKYEGDAIIAFWNAPLDQPDHGLRACRAALRCQKRLEDMQADLQARFGKGLRMRVGVNTGPAVVGNMGSANRFDYTAMGDTINLASRLEGACKQYGVPILIGEETFARVKDAVVCREVDTIRVVGKSKPVRVYEALGEKGEIPADRAARLDVFHRALERYKNKEWTAALPLFEGLGDDSPARLYAGRCRNLIAQPPGPEWDGVFELKQK